MTYVTGSRTSAPSPSYEDLYNLIATQLTDHPNWDFVETYTISTTTWSVWRCGAANVTGVPYHVFFGRATGSPTDLYVGLAEGYDVATHSYTRPAPVGTSSNLTPTADGSYSTTPIALTATTTSVTSQFRSPLIASSTAYDYRIAVNNDALYINVTNPTQYAVVVSPFDSLVVNPAVNDPMPLLISDARSTSGSSSGTVYALTTRHPLVTTAQPRLWGVNSLPESVAWPGSAKVGTAGGTGDLFQSGKPTGARVLVRSWGWNYNTNGAATVGQNRGLYRHVIQLAIATGVVSGDTVTIGADTYVYMGNNDNWYNTSVV